MTWITDVNVGLLDLSGLQWSVTSPSGPMDTFTCSQALGNLCTRINMASLTFLK